MTKESPKLISEDCSRRFIRIPLTGSARPGVAHLCPAGASRRSPTGWTDVQEDLAESLNLSVLLVDGHQPPCPWRSQITTRFARLFSRRPNSWVSAIRYCGDAHRRAISAGSTIQYKCHAGLQCFTMPVKIGRKKTLRLLVVGLFSVAIIAPSSTGFGLVN